MFIVACWQSHHLIRLVHEKFKSNVRIETKNSRKYFCWCNTQARESSSYFPSKSNSEWFMGGYRMSCCKYIHTQRFK
jgi:hypothetical protein